MNPQIKDSHVLHHNLAPHLYSRHRKIRLKKAKETQKISDQNYIKTGDKLMAKSLLVMSVILIISVCLVALFILFSSCTLSFQNVDTHGTATDLIDENMSTDAQVSTDVDLPVK